MSADILLLKLLAHRAPDMNGRILRPPILFSKTASVIQPPSDKHLSGSSVIVTTASLADGREEAPLSRLLRGAYNSPNSQRYTLMAEDAVESAGAKAPAITFLINAIRSATWLTPRNRSWWRPSSARANRTLRSKATSVRCWRLRTGSISSYTTAELCPTHTASSPAVTTTRPPVPSQFGRARRSTPPPSWQCPSRLSRTIAPVAGGS